MFRTPNALRQLLMNLKEALTKRGLNPLLEPSTNQLFVTDEKTTMLFRLYPGDTRLQVLTYFNFQVPKDRFEAVLAHLNRLNFEVDLPGFGLDENNGLAYHRLMLLEPTDKQMDVYLDALPKLSAWAIEEIKLTAWDLAKT